MTNYTLDFSAQRYIPNVKNYSILDGFTGGRRKYRDVYGIRNNFFIRRLITGRLIRENVVFAANIMNDEYHFYLKQVQYWLNKQ